MHPAHRLNQRVWNTKAATSHFYGAVLPRTGRKGLVANQRPNFDASVAQCRRNKAGRSAVSTKVIMVSD